MEKLIALLKSMPIAWRIVLVIALAVVVIALSFQSCVMINSSLRGEVSPPSLDSVPIVVDTVS